MKLTNFVNASNRAGNAPGDGQLANMATSLIKDIANEFPQYPELNPENNPAMIVGRDKVRGEKKRVFKSYAAAPLKQTCAIGFDGKTCDTLQKESFGVDGDKTRITKVKKEVITITDLENSSFVGEFSTESGKGKCVADGICKKLEEKNVDMNQLRILSVDSTVSNTGYKEGALSWIEEMTKKTFQWFICTCHLLELPLRKLTHTLVGESSGPCGFKSELGQRFEHMNHVPTPTSFERIECEYFPDINGKILCIFFSE